LILKPTDHLTEEFPDVADYLRSTLGSLISATQVESEIPMQQPSQYSQNNASEELTTNLMDSVQRIIQRAEAEGRDPEEELRSVVSRTVLEGILTGYEMTATGDVPHNDTPAKRSRTDGLN
jgi:hypothetical protein